MASGVEVRGGYELSYFASSLISSAICRSMSSDNSLGRI